MFVRDTDAHRIGPPAGAELCDSLHEWVDDMEGTGARD